MQDGLQLAGAVRSIRREGERQEDRQTEKDAMEVYGLMESGKDTSGYSDAARYGGAKKFWDMDLARTKSATQEQRLSTASMQDRIMKHQLNLTEAKELLRMYKTARASGNDEAAKNIAMTISNKHMYNGKYFEKGKGSVVKMVNWDNSEEELDFETVDMEEVDRLLGTYFEKSDDEILRWQMTGDQSRSQRNENILSQAEPYINEAGDIIYRVPRGTWGPDGKPRGAFFISHPGAKDVMADEDAKGYVKMDVAGKATDIKKKRKDLRKPDIVTPGSLVTSGGEAAAVVSKGGGLEVQPIKGDVDTASLPGSGKGASRANAAYNLKVKRLDTELMPFMDKGQSAIDPETLSITNDGRNAYMNALKLKQKSDKDPDSLSPEEQALVKNAIRAVQIYQSISEGNKQAFRLKDAPGKPQASAPPPGFTLD
jgi:hypothetical protein